MSNGRPWPKISIVTPSLNQGQFVEETILSVLGQGYPNLEYIVVDGGSVDNSVETIKKYEKYLTSWTSAPDDGQSDAINKGFARSTGEILAWLNSDDLYLPDALTFVAEVFELAPEIDLVTGGYIGYCSQTDYISAVRPCGVHLPPTAGRLFVSGAYCGQSSTFWRRRAWKNSGPLDHQLSYAMDLDFWIQCYFAGHQFKLVDRYLSIYRQHENQKTFDWQKYLQESQEVRSKYIRQHGSPKLFLWVATAWARLTIQLANHINIHPSVGLVPRCDEKAVRSWIAALRKEKRRLRVASFNKP